MRFQFRSEDIRILRWLQRLPVAKKLHVITILMGFTVLLSLAGMWFGMNTLAALRAYIGGEGIWSKAQKDATQELIRYLFSQDERDYQAFRNFLQVPLGDRQARLEMEKTRPDMDLIREGFLQGNNHPDDIPGMIALFRTFRWVSYVDTAAQIWAEGDDRILELQMLGEEIKTVIEQGELDTERVSLYLAEITRIDVELTRLENEFSFTLNDGARKTKQSILLVVGILTLITGSIVVLITYYIGEMVLRVDRAKSEFLSIASHQLRTPLAITNWYAEKLLRDDEKISGHKRRGYLQELYSANQHMAHLVDALLSASRIELGTFAVHPQPTNIVKIINKLIHELTPRIKSKELTVTHKHDNIPVVVYSDPDAMDMIFENLIKNAINYTHQHGTISIVSLVKADEALIEICDNGPGIPESEQPSVFKKFFRGESMRAKGTEGSGLGLYIVRSLVIKTGGDIWFNSEEGKGTCFYVSLPLDRRQK